MQRAVLKLTLNVGKEKEDNSKLLTVLWGKKFKIFFENAEETDKGITIM